MRLDKYLAEMGKGTRSQLKQDLKRGLVTVNGQVEKSADRKVDPSVDKVTYAGEDVSYVAYEYYLLHKPAGYISATEDRRQETVLDLIADRSRDDLFPVGRLDKDTEGLLLITNDGDLAARLTHPKYMKKKIYHVTCDKNVAMSDMDLLVNGIELEDGPVYADEVSYVNEADRSQIGVEIHSGKNRIVRRMLEHLGYRVNKLDRVLFAGLTKKNVKRGDWRYLTEKEVNMLRMGAYE